MATKKMRSSNWSEVNLVRWVEGQMSPVGGQAQYTYSFASRCKMIHGWYDLGEVYHIAYLCEQNIYVDTGGALVDITPAGGMTPPQPLAEGGYGDGPYGDSTYGTPRVISTIQALDKVPDAWSLDNFGAILLAMTSPDGRLLQWDPAVGGPAIPVVADSGRGVVPTGRLFVVTQERFVQIHGAYDSTNGGGQRRFAWCDQENFAAWDYSNVTSQAGFLDIEPAAPIITAKATPLGILFWTATTAYLSVFLGIPYVYNYTEIGKNCTPWSPCSVASTVSMTLWMSQQGLYSYNGAWIQPVPLKIRPWIDDDIDILNVREQACAVHVAPFNEFWWFFPQGPANNPSGYNTRVAIYNYKEGWCSMGRMSRSAGVSASYVIQTIMADGLNAFQHETGVVYPANVPLPWAETFDLNLASGSKLTTVKQMIPDIEGDVTNLLYSIFYRNSRSTGTPELQTTPRPVRSDGYVDFRTTGRDVRLRIALAGPQVNPVSVGQHLIDSVQRGDR
jgi:hypothetical protein